jgi:hypothetical protein
MTLTCTHFTLLLSLYLVTMLYTFFPCCPPPPPPDLPLPLTGGASQSCPTYHESNWKKIRFKCRKAQLIKMEWIHRSILVTMTV